VLAEFLEVSYVGVYPVLPIALVLHLLYVPDPDIDRFWTVILLTDYVCFGALPWIQTRPPRALEQRPPWNSAVRRFNLKLIGAASIHVNTFPSGHAAEASAAALLVIGSPLPVVITMAFAALAISAAAVFGRYHYLADALLGWFVALAVWALL
jgi:membrane-associated phospholipid phosphatase